MAVIVYIPVPFRHATGNRYRVEVAADSVASALDEVEQAFEGLRCLVRDSSGRIHDHVNIFVNSEAIDALDGLATPIRDGDEVAIIPALAGGAAAVNKSPGFSATIRVRPTRRSSQEGASVEFDLRGGRLCLFDAEGRRLG